MLRCISISLTERLQSVRETASLLCNRIMDNIEYDEREGKTP